MYIKDGICYADDPTPMMEVVSARAVDDNRLYIVFSNGSKCYFDKQHLSGSAFHPLKNASVFKNFVIEDGIVTWMNGEIDCAPEYMLEMGTPCEDDA